MKEYEIATNSHNFDNVKKLIAEQAIYWFSDGSFQGFDSIRKAFENTWKKVMDEAYQIKNLRWIAISEKAAACIYEFYWTGMIDGEKKSGNGRGTNVLVNDHGWKIVHEHLSRICPK